MRHEIEDLKRAGPETLEAAVRLNQEFSVELSDLDLTDLKALAAQAFSAQVVGRGMAFLLAFDQVANYGSQNFRWFQERFERFIYVDRIAVGTSARRAGLAGTLYAHLFALARSAGHRLVTCEVNVAPPNPASDAFHQALGFREVGIAATGRKVVRYLVKEL